MKYVTTLQRFTLLCADKLSAGLHRMGVRLFGADANPMQNKACSNDAADIANGSILNRTNGKHVVATVFVCLLCAVSVLSQTDFVAAIPFARFAVIGLWVPAFLYGAVKARLYLDKNVLLSLFPLLIFDAFILLIGLIRGSLLSYLFSPIFYAANLSAFVFLTGALFSRISDIAFIKSGIRVYVICTLCVAVYTMITTFSAVGFSSYIYAYSRKNSLAPIVLTAICAVMFVKPFRHNEWHTPLLIILGTFLVLLKSRANLIGLFVVLLIWYICALKKKEDRLRVLWNLCAVAFLVFTISTLRELVIDNILLNHRASAGLNGISSGRSEQITEAAQTLSVPFLHLFGNGYTYVECLPLAALLSYGIFSLLPLMLFAFVPVISAHQAKKTALSEPFVLFVLSISVAFLLNGIFEERAPFGPGTTYFMLWFAAGFSLSYNKTPTTFQ